MAVALSGYCQRAVIGREATLARQEILPMLQTTWGQGSPYNLQCPVKSGVHCQTGCVATAMAQIMFFHKCPAEGYDWQNMCLTYTGSETDEQKQAVAKLMADCGKAVNMEYGIGSSAAYAMDAAAAFASDFGYQETSGELYRFDYSDEEWEEMIYNELAAGRPVLYSGYFFNDTYQHQFVCDGYKDGKFHFNMAWSLVRDGYYTLDEVCSSYSQTAVLKILPKTATPSNSPQGGEQNSFPWGRSGRGKKIEVYRLANLCLYKLKD